MEQTSQWGLQIFKDPQNYTESYEVIWTLLLSPWLCVHMACWHFTWPLWGRFEICVVLRIVMR